MSVYEELVDHDQVFHHLKTPPVIANDLDISTLEGKEKLNQLLYSRYEGDALNILPQCGCGKWSGGRFLGRVCEVCNTVCQPAIEKPLESLIWFTTPEGVQALINPTAWIIMSNVMTTSGFNLLEWLCNPTYKWVGKAPPKLMKLEQFMERNRIPRSLNSFYENFDNIITMCFGLKLIKESGPQRNDMSRWIEQNRHKIFSKYIPMPSKIGFVVEATTTTAFIDKTITLALDALHTIVSIRNSVSPLPVQRKQVRVVKAIVKLAEFYSAFVNKTLGRKPGAFRKHTFGGRLHFTARAVISSPNEPHEYDELHTPWSLSLQLLKVHLTNKLLRAPYRMNPLQIEKLLRDSALKYNPILDKLFKELIEESPYKGLPVIFQRNPSLARGSAQALYITKVKTDPNINTISFSPLALKAPNADYDGDEMNMMLILDEIMHTKLSRLAPHLGALDLGAPRKISGNLALPGPTVSTISNWMYRGL